MHQYQNRLKEGKTRSQMRLADSPRLIEGTGANVVARHARRRRRSDLTVVPVRPCLKYKSKGSPRFLVVIPYFWQWCSGGDLLSHTLAGAVPSALGGLASGFGMGPGVSLSL